MGIRMAQKSWQAYDGVGRRLVIAVDIGTTFSGASYCLLNPGEKPKIIDVGAFPFSNGVGNYKTSSSVLYGQDGCIMAIGNEVHSERTKELAVAANAVEARWWKLGLGNKNSFNEEEEEEERQNDDDDAKSDSSSSSITEHREIVIPQGKKAEDIYADYLEWMIKHVEKFIASYHQGGAQLVEETRNNRLLVLTHPNGWEGVQQKAMRRACIRARVVSDVNRAATLVKFVSEAEASMTYALMCDTMTTWNQVGSQIAIVDAGGGTIDMTAYRIESNSPYVSVSEICIPQCFFEGSVTVDNRARNLLRTRLHGTRWDNDEDIDTLMSDFVRTIKHSFANERTPCLLKIGTAVDYDKEIGLHRGNLIFEGNEIANLFSDAIQATINGLRNIFATYNPSQERRVAFVGGFSENVYFRHAISKALGPQIVFAKPDNATAKAVANGAVAWAIDGVVQVRKAKMWYGIRCAIPFDKQKKSHMDRLHLRIQSADGQSRLPDAFHVICCKGDEVTSGKDIKAPFSLSREANEDLRGTFDLIVYRGDDTPPEFIDDKATGFEVLCSLEVSLDRLQHAIPTQTINGKRFKMIRFEIHINLFETELTARWVWDEQTISHSGTAETVYLDDLEFFTRKASDPLKIKKEEQKQIDPKVVQKNKYLNIRSANEEYDSNDDVSTISSLTGGDGTIDSLTPDQLAILIKTLECKRQTKQQLNVLCNSQKINEVETNKDSSLMKQGEFNLNAKAQTPTSASSHKRRQPPPVPARSHRDLPAIPLSSNPPPTKDEKKEVRMSELARIGHTASLAQLSRYSNERETIEEQLMNETLSTATCPPPPPPYDFNAEAECER